MPESTTREASAIVAFMRSTSSSSSPIGASISTAS